MERQITIEPTPSTISIHSESGIDFASHISFEDAVDSFCNRENHRSAWKHYFCVSSKMCDDHHHCTPRDLTEEEYSMLLRTGVHDKDLRILENFTEEQELKANTTFDYRLENVNLKVFGEICQHLKNANQLIKMIKRCTYKYQLDSLFSGLFEDMDMDTITDLLVDIVEDIPENYVFNDTTHTFGNITEEYFHKVSWEAQHVNLSIRLARRVRKLDKQLLDEQRLTEALMLHSERRLRRPLNDIQNVY